MTSRDDVLRKIGSEKIWDVLVIGGGATGLGTAVDAAARGYRTLLLEQADFAKGTSSRSTKLSHGGVRYLQQGNIALVLEALQERGRMLQNAPHLVRKQSFIIPADALWQIPFYGVGLKIYDALSGRSSFGTSQMLSAAKAHSLLPGVAMRSMQGGIQYFDGQFDDARMAIALMRTLEDLGGVALNYARVTRLLQVNGRTVGVEAEDAETRNSFTVEARVVINATGVFAEKIRNMDQPCEEPLLTVSQGSHFVLPKEFLPGTHALMVPRTSDGRVLFAIPWHGAVVVGTTDEPVDGPSLEPHALKKEQSFLFEHIGKYFGRSPQPGEIRSMWSGLRPLVRKQGAKSTAALSREHSVLVSPSGMVTVVGGKWTTYRRMAQDTVDIAARTAGLPVRACTTANLHLHGWVEAKESTGNAAFGETDGLHLYGSEAAAIQQLAAQQPELARQLHPRLSYMAAEVVWAARFEMARTVEDVLARRTRALFVDAQAASEAAPRTAQLLATELGRDAHWIERQELAFQQLAASYTYQGESGATSA